MTKTPSAVFSFGLAFCILFSLPLLAESLQTAQRYEECLIANGALLLSSDIDRPSEAVRIAAANSCSYAGPNRGLVEGAAKVGAEKALPGELKRIDAITDRDFIRQASCIAEEAVDLIQKRAIGSIREAAKVGRSRCPRLEGQHKRDMWEVYVAAQMDIAQQLEAISDKKFYSKKKLEADGIRLDSEEFWDYFSHINMPEYENVLRKIPSEEIEELEVKLLGRLVNCAARYQINRFGSASVNTNAVSAGLEACEDMTVSFFRVCSWLYNQRRVKTESTADFCSWRIVTWIGYIARGRSSLSDINFDMPVMYWHKQSKAQ